MVKKIKLKDENYGGFNIQFTKIGNKIFARVNPILLFKNIGFNVKIELLNYIKNEIDKFKTEKNRLKHLGIYISKYNEIDINNIIIMVNNGYSIFARSLINQNEKPFEINQSQVKKMFNDYSITLSKNSFNFEIGIFNNSLKVREDLKNSFDDYIESSKRNNLPININYFLKENNHMNITKDEKKYIKNLI